VEYIFGLFDDSDNAVNGNVTLSVISQKLMYTSLLARGQQQQQQQQPTRLSAPPVSSSIVTVNVCLCLGCVFCISMHV